MGLLLAKSIIVGCQLSHCFPKLWCFGLWYQCISVIAYLRSSDPTLIKLGPHKIYYEGGGSIDHPDSTVITTNFRPPRSLWLCLIYGAVCSRDVYWSYWSRSRREGIARLHAIHECNEFQACEWEAFAWFVFICFLGFWTLQLFSVRLKVLRDSSDLPHLDDQSISWCFNRKASYSHFPNAGNLFHLSASRSFLKIMCVSSKWAQK